MKKNIFLTIIMVFGYVNAQQRLLDRNEMNVYLNDNANKELGMDDVKGSPYFYNAYSYAFVNDNTAKPHMLRYNAYSDVMEFERDGVKYDLEKEILGSVSFDVPLKKKYVYLNYSIDSKSINGYLVELNSGGKYSLYKNERIEFVPERSSPNGFGESKTIAEFKPQKTTYFVNTEKGIFEIPKSKDKFAKLFGDDGKNVSEFIKKNKISLNEETDLIKVFKNLNN